MAGHDPFGDGGLGVGLGGGLHRVHDQTDQQVDHGESGDQDEGQEERPGIGMHLHHRAHHRIGPAFQRHHLKQRQGRRPQIAKAVGKAGPEKLGGHHRRHVEDDHGQQHHRSQAALRPAVGQGRGHAQYRGAGQSRVHSRTSGPHGDGQTPPGPTRDGRSAHPLPIRRW